MATAARRRLSAAAARARGAAMAGLLLLLLLLGRLGAAAHADAAGAIVAAALAAPAAVSAGAAASAAVGVAAAARRSTLPLPVPRPRAGPPARVHGWRLAGVGGPPRPTSRMQEGRISFNSSRSPTCFCRLLSCNVKGGESARLGAAACGARPAWLPWPALARPPRAYRPAAHLAPVLCGGWACKPAGGRRVGTRAAEKDPRSEDDQEGVVGCPHVRDRERERGGAL